jgi:hypothetical protein
MIDIEALISFDNYKTVGYYTRSHVDKNLFLDAVLKEDDFDEEPQVSDVKHEYWKIDEEIDDDLKEYYSLSKESDPHSFPITVIYLDHHYEVRFKLKSRDNYG